MREPHDQQLAGFINKFDKRDGALIRAVRKVLQKRMPSANELAYDNYNFFVIGSAPPGGRPIVCFRSLRPRTAWDCRLTAELRFLSDPHKRLLGGSQNRHIRIESIVKLGRPEGEELIAAAIRKARNPLPAGGKGKLIIRSVARTQALSVHDTAAGFKSFEPFAVRQRTYPAHIQFLELRQCGNCTRQ